MERMMNCGRAKALPFLCERYMLCLGTKRKNIDVITKMNYNIQQMIISSKVLGEDHV